MKAGGRSSLDNAQLEFHLSGGKVSQYNLSGYFQVEKAVRV
jgi:hypothetical protein